MIGNRQPKRRRLAPILLTIAVLVAVTLFARSQYLRAEAFAAPSPADRAAAASHSVRPARALQASTNSVPLDTTFNRLPASLTAAAYAYLPARDQVVLAGGIENGANSDSVLLVDAGTGESTSLGTLPVAQAFSTAAYVPAQDTTYLFGGTVDEPDGLPWSVAAIDHSDGSVSVLRYALLDPLIPYAAAVYHPTVGDVYIFGGEEEGALLSGVRRWDPDTTAFLSFSGQLPSARADLAAAYSHLTDSIYLFGGRASSGSASDTIIEVDVSASGSSATLNEITTAQLPYRMWAMAAVEDPVTGLIYILGGGAASVNTVDRVIAFDPLTGELWETLIEIPEERTYPAAVFSPSNRHALLIGGNAGSNHADAIWRIALGDGPAVPLGHWDLPTGVGSSVNAIHGAADRVFIATESDGLWRYEAGGTRTQYDQTSELNTNQINDVRYNPATGYAYVAAGSGGWIFNDADGDFAFGTGLTSYAAGFRPAASNPLEAYFFGTDNGLRWNPENGSASTSLSGRTISALATLGNDRVWLIADDELTRFRYTDDSSDSLTFGVPCEGQLGADDWENLGDVQSLAFDQGDNLWIAIGGGIRIGSDDQIFGQDGGLCFYPAPASGGDASLYRPIDPVNPDALGAFDVSVDGDNRVWIPFAEFDFNNGSPVKNPVLYGYQALEEGNTLALRNEPFSEAGTAEAVGGVDERVWIGQTGGSLTTLAQRWQQLEQDTLNETFVRKLWLARGRAFMATTTGDLHVLQPDGETWDSHNAVDANALLADRRGRIWVGTDTGVRLYTPDGLSSPPDPTDNAPAGPIYALAEDRDGRIWIGGADGLTLYDRERFVFTLTAANSDLPRTRVNTLLVDRNNRVWAGTGTAANNSGGLLLLDGGTQTVYDTDDGLPHNAVTDLAELPDGRIAVSTYGGDLLNVSTLALLEAGSFVTQEVPRYFPAVLWHLPLTVDDEGRLWAGSAVLRASGWHGYYDTNSGLRSSMVADVAADGADRVWFSHSQEAPGVSVRGSVLPPLANAVPYVDPGFTTSGSAGDVLTIPATGLGDSEANISVRLGGDEVEVVDLVTEGVRVRVGEETHSGSISVSANGQRLTLGSAADPAFCAIPVIEGFSPTGGNDGVRVEVYGTNFDADPEVTLGGPQKGLLSGASATLLRLQIEAGDGGGPVTVTNRCGDSPQTRDDFTAESELAFRRYTPHIATVRANQGFNGVDVINDKPTLVQAYLSVATALRPNDTLEVDEIEITLGDGTSADNTFTIDTPQYVGAVPHVVGSVTEAHLASILQSVHVTIRPQLDDDLLRAASDAYEMQVTMRRRGVTVATATSGNSHQTASPASIDAPAAVTQWTGRIDWLPNIPMHVLLVPILPAGYGVGDLENSYDTNLGNLEQRMWPTGNVTVAWADEPIVADDPIVIGFWHLLKYAHKLDRTRQLYNMNHKPNALVAVGVVHPRSLASNNEAAGHAWWADLSQYVNQIGVGLPVVDTLCDLGNALIGTVSFGSLGLEGGCGLDIPLYIGLTEGSVTPPMGGDIPNNLDAQRVSSVVAHEMGHMVGLVKPYHLNHALDNITHSRHDELDGGECADLATGAATYNPDKSLARRPFVQNPVINPITAPPIQFTPSLNTMATATVGGVNVTNQAVFTRAKSLMSYACRRFNNNAFFEPIDLIPIYLDMRLQVMTDFRRRLDEFVAPSALSFSESAASATMVTTHTIPGTRLYVSGVVDRVENSSQIRRVEARGEAAPLSVPLVTSYWLVQRDAGGTELGRDAVFPLFASAGENHTPVENDSGFFAATILRRDGVATLELRHDETLLATYAAGDAPPSVDVSSPNGGSYNSGSVPVTWTADDPDGDALEVVIAYSPDGGSTWSTVASGQNSGTVDVPLAQLAGSSDARIRVTASDGFHLASATSISFTVAAQYPRPVIRAPRPSAAIHEDAHIVLRGAAHDNQDGWLEGNALRWSSDRDGFLGTGQEAVVSLSAGTHTLTLEATNSAGLTQSSDVEVTVSGDYDHDGIPDDEELSAGLSPLTSHDAFSDADGDGLSLIVERQWGTDPDNADTDGDGREDSDEVVSGSDPLTQDDPPVIDNTLMVAPGTLTFDTDLSLDVPLPQQRVAVSSQTAVSWTLTADVPWLAASAAVGQTPAGTTIAVETFKLDNGTHTGELYFRSAASQSAVTVPVTVTVTNSAAYFDNNADGDLNVGDVQAVADRIPSDNGQTGWDYHYDIDRDGDVDQTDDDLIADAWLTGRSCCTASPPQGAAILGVSAPVSTTVGATVTLGIQIQDPQNLAGFEFDLGFDPAVLQVENVVLGDVLGSSGRTPYPLGPVTDDAAGALGAGGYTAGEQPGVDTDGLLTEVTLRAVGTGASPLTLDNPLLADPQGGLSRPTEVVDATIEVVSTGQNVEPAIWLPLVIR